MYQTVKLEKVYVNEVDKAGNAYTSKQTGAKQVRVTIYTTSMPKTAISAFVSPDSPATKFKPGDQVTIEIIERGDFMNFKLPNGSVPQSQPIRPAQPGGLAEAVEKLSTTLKLLQEDFRLMKSQYDAEIENLKASIIPPLVEDEGAPF